MDNHFNEHNNNLYVLMYYRRVYIDDVSTETFREEGSPSEAYPVEDDYVGTLEDFDSHRINRATSALLVYLRHPMHPTTVSTYRLIVEALGHPDCLTIFDAANEEREEPSRSPTPSTLDFNDWQETSQRYIGDHPPTNEVDAWSEARETLD